MPRKPKPTLDEMSAELSDLRSPFEPDSEDAMPVVVTDPRPSKATKWIMPKPKIPLVTWRFGDNRGKPYTAIVVATYDETIDVMVFPDGSMLPQPYTGCRHVDDPSLRSRTGPNAGGLFELCEVERELARLTVE